MAWRVLRRRFGLPAVLVLGATPFPFRAHAWVECGPHVVTDDRTHCETYTPVARWLTTEPTMLAGFTALWDGEGRVEFRVHGPRAAEGRPRLVTAAHDAPSGAAALLVGGLLYRDDADGSDAALALAAYRRGGVAALERLEGEFALLVWDGAARRLIALRDPLGSWPLFWSARGPLVAVSGSLEALVRLRPGRSFDEDYLADYLTWPNPHAELPTERTAFEGIRRVLPGTVVEFGPGASARPRRYWDWEERIRPSPGITREEAARACAALLREAVGQRVRRGPAAAHLFAGTAWSSPGRGGGGEKGNGRDWGGFPSPRGWRRTSPAGAAWRSGPAPTGGTLAAGRSAALSAGKRSEMARATGTAGAWRRCAA